MDQHNNIDEYMLFGKSLKRNEYNFEFDLKDYVKDNILNEEKLFTSNIFVISVVKEENRNKGQDSTSYFKLFRQPSKGKDTDNCLRISIFKPEYTIHIHTDKKPLNASERKALIDILVSPYIPKNNMSQIENYNKMIDTYNKELNKFYMNPKNKNIKYPERPIVWVAILYYFNYVNELNPGVSLLLPMPNYMLLPNK